MSIGTSRITAKGQITIPKAVREVLALRVGDEVLFVADGSGASLHLVPRRELRSLRGVLRGKIRFAGRASEREAARDWVARKVVGRRP